MPTSIPRQPRIRPRQLVRPTTLLLTLVLLVALVVRLPPVATHARPAPGDAGDAVALTLQGGGVALAWQNSQQRIAASGTAQQLAGWQPVEIGGWQLPARLIPLRVTDAAAVQASSAPAIALQRVESVPWDGTLHPADVAVPRRFDGSTWQERPALAPEPPRSLPTAPVTVLRDGRMRGERLIVVALTPVFEHDGVVHAATAVQAFVPGTAPLDAPPPAAPAAPRPSPAPQSDAAWAQRIAAPTWKITVTAGGMQQLRGTALQAAGLQLAALDPALLRLWHAGAEVALEERGTADGRLDAGDELRFSAPPPGDRWNATASYWLTIGDTPGLRMRERDAMPNTAPPRTTAFQQSTWRDNRAYDSTLPGADGDHWFAADLRANPGDSAATLPIHIEPTMPLTGGVSTFRLSGSAYVPALHQLDITMGAAVSRVTWSGSGDWTRTVSFTTTATPDITVSLLPGATPSGIMFDSVVWQVPVRLDARGEGGMFTGAAGTWRYLLINPPGGYALYDVSDPLQPVRLAVPQGNPLEFEDGPDARHYLLSGPGTLHSPEVAPHAPVTLFAAPAAAEALYIAPAPFHDALQPLVALRQRQGYSTLVVAVQDIYDTWSYGQVDPSAIRAFLRHAVATWQTPPLAVTLVGDGSYDPRNYQHEDATLIPPYLAVVDPWLGETACDSCYARLDSDDVLDDPLPDVWIGRLPVNTAAELATVVAKITAYESDTSTAAWQSRMLAIADNYRDSGGRTDGAGDFAAFADTSTALQPSAVSIERLYYDPSPSHTTAPWREPDAGAARLRTLALLRQGAGLVNYAGHSFYWQWAVTDETTERPYLMAVTDIETLTNGERLPVVLQMTCLTGGFHQHPAGFEKVIDEQLLLHDGGGAVAAWGSTGLGVAYGHDRLQAGFYRRLWQDAPTVTAPLGALTEAGYRELFTTGACCQESLQTYVLTGDPLTVPRISATARLYLPLLPQVAGAE